MRKAFFRALADLATENKQIVLLTADIGYMAIESFSERFPDRYCNVGVSEQNLVGVATGFAEAGFIPFVYTIAPFATLRPYEFIRNGPIQHQMPVRIVGVGGGIEYAHDGFSHYALEDVAVMRVQPGMKVIVPADGGQACSALRATWNMPGPIYYRLGKDDRIVIPDLDARFHSDSVEIIRKGKDVLFLSMGPVTTEVVAAANQLSQLNIQSTVAVIASIQPAPEVDLANLLGQFEVVITVEAHYVTGGIGSLTSELVAERGIHCRVQRCGVRENPAGFSGDSDYLHGRFGINANSLASLAERCVSENRAVRRHSS